MNTGCLSHLRRALPSLLSACLLVSPSLASAWVQPTEAELHAGAPAFDPKANAVYLSYDERDDDTKNVQAVSVRLKVLNETGVQHFSDIAMPVTGRNFSIADIEARTIHPDGSVVIFTGKPHVKTLHYHGETYKATVFSMPDVQPGSILEYSYMLTYSDNVLLPAHWFLQHDAPALHEHYTFLPFDTSGMRTVTIDHGQTSQGLFYASWLPKEAKVIPPNTAGHKYYELTLDNVPPLPDEESLPPLHSFSYRLLFYYAAQLKSADYWKTEGKYFGKDVDHFASADGKMRSDVAALTAPGDTPDVKARKLYAAAMKIENTDFSRTHSSVEDQQAGLRPVHTASDIWARQRGSSDEIALTYLAMLRAAGIQAYAMRVTNRDQNIFEPSFIDMSQLDDTIVVAELDGKEVYLDPGARFCPFGQLEWKHSYASGLRQTAGGTAIAASGPLNYKDTFLRRIAQLALSPDGEVSGTVTLSYTGQAATVLREREDGEAPADTQQRMEDSVREMLPAGLKLHMISLTNLEDGEKPLTAIFAVHGPVGTVTGHRLIFPQALLRGDEKERFAAATRQNAVYFHYPYASLDIVELQLDPGLQLEAVPQEQKSMILNDFAYDFQVAGKGNVVDLTRSVAVGGMIVPVSDYGQLRSFFGNLRAADQNQVLFTRTADAATTASAAAAPAH